MTLFAYLALLGWIPLGITMFAVVPARKAVAFIVVGGLLILPPYTLDISGLPDYSRIMAASISVILGTVIFAPDRFLNFRPRWFDLPMLAWCFSSMASSLYNGLGVYDGLAATLSQVLTWGLPYLIGRIYFGNPEDLRYFAVAVVIGGLAYVLPCLYEARMSPKLMKDIYGISQLGAIRFGGWRPTVFFWTGLELGMWMTATSLVAGWLWYCGALKQIGSIPLGSVLLPTLLGTSFLCRSTGALLLLFAGLALLWVSTRLKTRLLLAGLILVGPAYVFLRLSGAWTGQQAVDMANSAFGPDRAQSLEYRFMCENLLAAKAMQQPMFGWGGWGRATAFFDEDATFRVQTDGMWVIVLGSNGVVGLTVFYIAFVLPVVLFLWRFPAKSWGDPRLAAGSLTAVLLGVYMIDCLLNAFPNIIYVTLAGGLSSLDPRQLRAIAGDRRGIEPAGRRAAGSGRLTLADRCRAMGRSFKQEGRLHEAEAAWRQSLDLLGALLDADPGSDELRRRWCDCANDLAWLMANHPDPSRRDPSSAASMALRAVDEYPASAAYWNTLGVAHYRAGDDRSAVDALDRARALGGGTAFDDVFLAMAHTRLGIPEEARRALARAMLQAERDHPGHPELAAFCDEAHALLAGAAIPAAR